MKDYAANIHTTTKTDVGVKYLKEEILAQGKQTAEILAQNIKIMKAMMKWEQQREQDPRCQLKKIRPTHICPVCNKMATHSKEDYFKDHNNKDKRPSWYKE